MDSAFNIEFAGKSINLTGWKATAAAISVFLVPLILGILIGRM